MTPVATPTIRFQTMDELLHALGDVPPHRIRLHPTPGTATVADVERFTRDGKLVYELVDGTLVEKAMGYRESRLATILGYFIEEFLEKNNLGITAGEQGMLEILTDKVRGPDLSFISWDRLPNRTCPTDAVPHVAPNLAVEVLSEGNTKAEMARKRTEYFKAGTELVWEVDPAARSVSVYPEPKTPTVLKETDTLDGGSVLPGFTLSIRRWFERADRGA